jgi:hypothetical protein
VDGEEPCAEEREIEEDTGIFIIFYYFISYNTELRPVGLYKEVLTAGSWPNMKQKAK